jgi:hypothetical protein
MAHVQVSTSTSTTSSSKYDNGSRPYNPEKTTYQAYHPKVILTTTKSAESLPSTSAQAEAARKKETKKEIYKPPPGIPYLQALKLIRANDPKRYFSYLLKKEKCYLVQREIQDEIDERYGFPGKQRRVFYEAARVKWTDSEEKYYKKAVKQMMKDVTKHPQRPILMQVHRILSQELFGSE